MKESISRVGSPEHVAWIRRNAAELLSRFFFLEEAITQSCAAWIPSLTRLESKAALARIAWQCAINANALRERVFELKYPSRLLHVDRGEPVVNLFRATINAPSGIALADALRTVVIPSLAEAYRTYLAGSDDVADGPTQRFLDQAIRDKDEQCEALKSVATNEPTPNSDDRERSQEWVTQFARLLNASALTSLTDSGAEMSVPEVVAPGTRFVLAQEPGRDDRYWICDFYWPDIVDPSYPYGEGAALQLRSAISHINEVWAVETAAAILPGLAEKLGWEFVHEAARWLYDEARHMTMGQRRLETWQFDRAEIPLGRYIYQACRDQDLIYRIGMLGYFETKNIGKKQERARAFERMGDGMSQVHMDFDWADETLHAEYGRRWLKRLLRSRELSEDRWAEVLETCEQLVSDRIAEATPAQKLEIRQVADRLVARSEQLLTHHG